MVSVVSVLTGWGKTLYFLAPPFTTYLTCLCLIVLGIGETVRGVCSSMESYEGLVVLRTAIFMESIE